MRKTIEEETNLRKSMTATVDTLLDLLENTAKLVTGLANLDMGRNLIIRFG